MFNSEKSKTFQIEMICMEEFKKIVYNLHRIINDQPYNYIVNLQLHFFKQPWITFKNSRTRYGTGFSVTLASATELNC